MDLLLAISFDAWMSGLHNPVPGRNGFVSATCPICQEPGMLAAGPSDTTPDRSILSVYCLCEPKEILEALGIGIDQIVPKPM